MNCKSEDKRLWINSLTLSIGFCNIVLVLQVLNILDGLSRGAMGRGVPLPPLS